MIKFLRYFVVTSILIFFAGIASATDTTGTYYTNFEAYHGPQYTSPDGVTFAGCYGLPNTGDNWRVYESAHYLVYSDVAESDYYRKYLADVAETELEAIKTMLSVSDSDLGIDPTVASTKLHICSDGVGSNASGGRSGISMPALNGTHVEDMDRLYCYAGYRKTVRHETVHVVHGIIAKETNLGYDKSDLWFTEGLAVYLSDQNTLSDTYSLAAYYADGRPNPVSVKRRTDMPGLDNNDIYPAFGLAVKYLFDTEVRGGAGNSISNLRGMFLNLSVNQPFTDAFYSYFSRGGSALAISNYKDNFSTWMNTYLTPLQTPATVTGISGIQMAGIFKYRCDMIEGQGATVSSGNFAMNVSEWADGDYPICFMTNTDTGEGVGPGTASVLSGRLIPTSYDVTSWTSPLDQGSAEIYKIGTATPIFQTIQKAYTALNDNDTLQILTGDFTGGLLLSLPKTVKLQGGYDCTFTSNTGYSTVRTSMTVSGGKVIVERLKIK
jgi:hypothetical protein